MNPAAFMTYTHVDDRYGDLATFCERLSIEVEIHLGVEFPIFLDRKSIQWGQNWKQRIDESLDSSTFLIAILSPGFFNSEYCRKELQRFLDREKQLRRNDLVLPVYYVDTPQMNAASECKGDSLAEMIADRQRVDWRELRNKSFSSQEVRDRLTELAKQTRDAWRRAAKICKPAAADVRRPQSAKPAGAMAESDIQSKAEPAKGGQQSNRSSTKTEPPTIVVDQMARGDYLTISEAIAAAKPGTLIRVQPGHYREGLIIDKPLEIVGDGDRGDVIVEATGADAVLFKTTMGRIANLTLRQDGGGEWYTVDIGQGRLELEDCDISSRSLACVAIHSGADARIRRNRIHDGSTAGVFVYENGKGTLEENDIFGNTLAGLAIQGGGDPTVRQNRIRDNKSSGVFVYESGGSTLEDNDIFGNTLAGVQLKEGGNPTLRRNRRHDNKQAGVLVNQNGRGTFEDNDIFGNAFAGVAIKQSGNPTLRGNRITNNWLQGVRVRNGGQGVIENNDLRGNARGAWFISPDCLDKVKRSNNKE